MGDKETNARNKNALLHYLAGVRLVPGQDQSWGQQEDGLQLDPAVTRRQGSRLRQQVPGRITLLHQLDGRCGLALHSVGCSMRVERLGGCWLLSLLRKTATRSAHTQHI